MFCSFAHRGAPPPGPPTLDPGVHILPIFQILYGPYGLYNTHIPDIIWTVRSIYNSTYQKIWTVRPIYSWNYQKIWTVGSIYSSTYQKIVENRKIHGVLGKSKIFKYPYLKCPCVKNPKYVKNQNISEIEQQKQTNISNSHQVTFSGPDLYR